MPDTPFHEQELQRAIARAREIDAHGETQSVASGYVSRGAEKFSTPLPSHFSTPI